MTENDKQENNEECNHSTGAFAVNESQYVQSDLNIQKPYRMWMKKQCAENNPALSIDSFKDIFYELSNIGS